MKESLFLERIERMDKLIQRRSAGRAEDLSRRLGISTRSVFNMLRIMREDFNAPIVYDKGLNTYRYTSEGEIVMSFMTRNKT